MPVTVVVGGQFGSEGKGKITSYLALKDDASIVVRGGGPNAGHTVLWNNERHALRQVPAGFINPRTRLLLAAGSIVDPELLRKEVNDLRVEDRIGVDRNASILEIGDAKNETERGMLDRFGSTLSGTGSATSRKVLRDSMLRLAVDEPTIVRWTTDVSEEANAAVDRGELVLVEGTQGFGLSLHHGGNYPFATSRDTSAAAFLSEAGLSPFTVADIILVLRTFPIRVAGNSGPLDQELTWAGVREMSGYPHDVSETTTVTGRQRRVAQFSVEVVERAVRVNRPSHLAIHGLDYLAYEDLRKTSFQTLSKASRTFVDHIENRLNVPATFLFTGPENESIIDRRPRAIEVGNNNRRRDGRMA